MRMRSVKMLLAYERVNSKSCQSQNAKQTITFHWKRDISQKNHTLFIEK